MNVRSSKNKVMYIEVVPQKELILSINLVRYLLRAKCCIASFVCRHVLN